MWLDFVRVFQYFLEDHELKSSIEGLGVIASSGYMKGRVYLPRHGAHTAKKCVG